MPPCGRSGVTVLPCPHHSEFLRWLMCLCCPCLLPTVTTSVLECPLLPCEVSIASTSSGLENTGSGSFPGKVCFYLFCPRAPFVLSASFSFSSWTLLGIQSIGVRP